MLMSLQELCKSCTVPVILLYFGANYATMTLQELCKTSASLVGRSVTLLYFGANWKNCCTTLMQEFYYTLFYFIVNGQTA